MPGGVGDPSSQHRPRLRARRVLLEVCIESVADAKAAAHGGADRLELNSALALDGLTPSPGLLREVRRAVGSRIPIVAMARPRAGDFCYDDAEFRVLLRDVEWLLEEGADGIAFGILTHDGEVDLRRCRRVVRSIESTGRKRRRSFQGAVFHRAFDRTRNPFAAMEQLIDLGFRRVMTSGQQPTALCGASLLAQLIERAAGRVEILPAGGVRPSNVVSLLSGTGADQLHSSLRESGANRMSSSLLSELIKKIATL
jgi:copper homeostasis protein